MKDKKIKNNQAGNRKESLVESGLLILCLIVIVLRVTFTEAPTMQPTQIQAAINDTVYSLCLSGVMIFAFLFRFLYNLWTGRRSYRQLVLVAGLVIFVAGAVIAGINASNKRAAVTSSVTVIAPLLMAIILGGLLNSHHRIRILLAVIAALGVVTAWQSAEQYFVSNAVILQKYNDDPNEILGPLGIQPGSFNQILLEHRLMSQDIRATFTTGNSAGSFAILACFATIAFLADRLKQNKQLPVPSGNITTGFFVLAAAFFSLFITRSKGAIGAFFVSAIIFAILLRSRRPKLLKNVILAVSIIGVIILATLVGWYGLKYGRLPGGNSMLVRWQYWQASVKMLFENILTGAGPGNFMWSYHHYKDPSALETISDPHCFVLSILTQYGIFGLFGFLMFVLTPLFKTTMAGPEGFKAIEGKRFGQLAAVCGLAVAVVVLAIRPFIVPASTAEYLDAKIYILFNEYAAPAVGFLVGFGVLIKSLATLRKDEYALQNTGVTSIALFCGIFAVLVHNLVDFAILEPGVLTAFCAVLGCLIAMDSRISSETEAKKQAPAWLKMAATAGVLIICLGYMSYVLIPVAKSTAKIMQADRPVEVGNLKLAHTLLFLATDDDRLSPDAPSKNGRLYLRHISWPAGKEAENLKQAEEALFVAVERNPEDYKNYEALGEVFYKRAQIEPEQKEKFLNLAVFYATRAVDFYPGDADLHYRLAEFADGLGQIETALEHYEKAVEIEDDYRELFRVMYPSREVVSRLPKEKYDAAKSRMKKLMNDKINPKSAI
ncbi:MAG: O-antigen ligase family protein [Sedimentisphaerales bacterium]|nr:O-antigen ligase family protein [Sedimentisphaerales bacterium]